MANQKPPGRESNSTREREVPGVVGAPAFSLSVLDPAPLPILIAVPHGGRVYPEALVASMRNPAAASLRLEDRFTDLVGETVARATGAALLVAHAPRAMIDLNRAPDDVDWDMVAGGAPEPRRLALGRRARSGLGLVPRRLPGLGEVWRRRMTPDDLADRLAQVHVPYHAALASGLETLRDQWGTALLIDLHSMPPLGPKRGADAAPDFVIGDRFGASCDPSLSATAFDHFTQAGSRVVQNRPYAGGYVLDRHAAPARGVHALQIEICRTCYLDERMQELGPGLAYIARILAGLVKRLAEELAAGRSLAQAAE